MLLMAFASAAACLQAHNALLVLPTAGCLDVPTAGQRAAWDAACAAALELDASHDAAHGPPQAGLAATVQRAVPARVGGAAAATEEEGEKAAAGAAAGASQDVSMFLPGLLCLSTAVTLDWLAQQLQDSEDSRKQLCIRWEGKGGGGPCVPFLRKWRHRCEQRAEVIVFCLAGDQKASSCATVKRWRVGLFWNVHPATTIACSCR